MKYASVVALTGAPRERGHKPPPLSRHAPRCRSGPAWPDRGVTLCVSARKQRASWNSRPACLSCSHTDTTATALLCSPLSLHRARRRGRALLWACGCLDVFAYCSQARALPAAQGHPCCQAQTHSASTRQTGICCGPSRPASGCAVRGVCAVRGGARGGRAAGSQPDGDGGAVARAARPAPLWAAAAGGAAPRACGRICALGPPGRCVGRQLGRPQAGWGPNAASFCWGPPDGSLHALSHGLS